MTGRAYYFLLPEAKGKSPEEIVELFRDLLATEQLEDINTSGKKGLRDYKHVESV